MIYQNLFDGPFPVRSFLFIKAVEIFRTWVVFPDARKDEVWTQGLSIKPL